MRPLKEDHHYVSPKDPLLTRAGPWHLYIYIKKSLKIWQAVIPLPAHHPQHRLSWAYPYTWKGDHCPTQATRPYSPVDRERGAFPQPPPERQKSTSILSKEKKIQKSIKTFKYEKPKGVEWEEAREERNWSFLGRKGLPCPPAH